MSSLFIIWRYMKGLSLMIIEKLDSSKVLISLNLSDMDTFELSIDKLNMRENNCKVKLKEIITLAFDKFSISTEQKAVLIEAMPHKEGLLIMAQVEGMRSFRKVYRIKKPRMLPCCRFSNAENLLACIQRLKAFVKVVGANSLWLYKEQYHLIFEQGLLPKGAPEVLSEYSNCSSMSMVRIARIKESGKELAKGNAICSICRQMQ